MCCGCIDSSDDSDVDDLDRLAPIRKMRKTEDPNSSSDNDSSDPDDLDPEANPKLSVIIGGGSDGDLDLAREKQPVNSQSFGRFHLSSCMRFVSYIF